MTDQEYFDTTIRHLLTQGPAREWDNELDQNRCRYRTKDGKSCAAGVHLPDALYNANIMEGTSIHSLLDGMPALRPFFPNVKLATALQCLHDRDTTWNDDGHMTESGRGEAAAIAHNFGLNDEVIHGEGH